MHSLNRKQMKNQPITTSPNDIIHKTKIPINFPPAHFCRGKNVQKIEITDNTCILAGCACKNLYSCSFSEKILPFGGF